MCLTLSKQYFFLEQLSKEYKTIIIHEARIIHRETSNTSTSQLDATAMAVRS